MTSKHTPGPWKVEPATPGFRAPCEDGAADMQIVGANLFCPGIILWDGLCLKEQEANARLIAAAPELLAALKAIKATYQLLEPEKSMVRAAIAKAEGR